MIREAAPRALVVEDFDQLRDLLLAGLRGAGYRADGAGSVAEAERMQPETYDVLVTDLRLGDADGATLLGLVGGRDPTIMSRCVLMTGGGYETDLPADIPVLVKPFRIEALLAAVRHVLAGGRHRLPKTCYDLQSICHNALETRRSGGRGVVTSAELNAEISVGLLETAPDAILAVDSRGRILLANAQAERLFGYRREELLGRPVEVLVPAGSRARHPTDRERYLADPRPRPMGAGMQLAGRRKDGTEFPAEISLSALHTDGDIIVSAAVRDVSDRRAAAEAQALLATIVSSSHDAIIGKTLDGTITSWNAAASGLYGYQAAEVLGRNADMLVPRELRQQEAEFLRRTAAGERVEQYETRRVRADGTEITVSLTMSPITTSAGEVVGVASVARDLTELQRAGDVGPGRRDEDQGRPPGRARALHVRLGPPGAHLAGHPGRGRDADREAVHRGGAAGEGPRPAGRLSQRSRRPLRLGCPSAA